MPGMEAATYLSSLVLSIAVSTAGSACSGYLCASGQCVSANAFCNRKCECQDCSDEYRADCQMQTDPTDDGNYSSGITSGAVIGIVVAAICVLLLIIAALIIFLICRVRREAIKNARSRRLASNDSDLVGSGRALPVDIPIQALAREPPPRYTPAAEGSALGNSRLPANFSISVLPPPYYSPEASSAVEMSYAFEAPPKYERLPAAESRQTAEPKRDLVEARAKAFLGTPLASSRSSGLCGDSCSGVGDTSGVLGSVQSDSARGDSTEWRLKRSNIGSTSGSSGLGAESRSRSMSNVFQEMDEVPVHGFQKNIKTFQKDSTGSYRSEPSLVLLQCRADYADGESRGKRREVKDVEINRSEAVVNDIRKEKSNHKRKTNQQHHVVNADVEQRAEGDLASNPKTKSSKAGNNSLKGTRQASLSLPTLQEGSRWDEIGSCDV